MVVERLQNLIEQISEKLTKQEKKLLLAESCTGGMLASYFVAIPGASKTLDRSIVTYSELAKQQELGVSADILSKYGAVSKECAIAMVEGLVKRGQNAICLSVTGLAGPETSEPPKPVGLVYFGLAKQNEQGAWQYQSFERHFHGSRDDIRLGIVEEACILLLKILD